MAYWIVTDIGSDLPQSYAKDRERFMILPMPYRMDGKEYEYAAGDEKNIGGFYGKLRDGHAASTAQITVMTYFTAFRELAARGESALYIGFSSGLSGSFQSSELAKAMVLEEFPNAKIDLVDSLCASLGQGLLVHLALNERDRGMSREDLLMWAVNNRQKVQHWFTVDDLNFLFRGGRVTRSAALVGSMLHIKPVLRVSYEGKLVPFEKVQGRRRSLKALAEKAIELASPREGQTVFISHGDCREDAEYVAELIRQGLRNTRDFLISPCGAIIGAHSGPGTVALFFLGESR